MARVVLPSARTAQRAAKAQERERRQWYINRARMHLDREGRLSQKRLRWLATHVPLSDRQLRRLVTQGGYVKRDALKIDEAIYRALQDKRNIAAVAEEFGIPRSTLVDAIQRDLSELDLLQIHGGDRDRAEAELRLELFHVFGECWQSDVKQVSVPVVHPWTGEVIEPLVMHTKCPACKALVGHLPRPEPFTAEDIVDGMRAAVEIREEHGPFGGTPESWQLDNASEHGAKEVVKYMDEIDVRKVNTLPYTPQGNGSVESFHRFVESRYAKAERFYTHRPTGRDGRTPQPVGGQPMSWPEFVDAYQRFVDGYNFEHKHSALEGTPVQAWERLSKRAAL